jgi:F5/8 type C domain/Bacterial Ig domain
MKSIAFAFSLSIAALGSVYSQDKILFIRGGPGTVGFFEGGSDSHAADVFNYSTNNGNHGLGELNAALVAEGFTIEQMMESPVISGVPTPIPLDTMNLNQYKVIVFGSNNAEYTTAQVNALTAYVQNGGSALFFSDANFGQNWGDAPSSDQYFLDRFGLVMNQDGGTYSVRRTNEFVVPAHPILVGVDEFDGEGVSPITRNTPPVGVSTTILTTARFGVRRNTGAGQGPDENLTANDATLVVGTFGAGRIAGHFDRNTFFNLNGAGTNINRLQNEAYSRNLFNWLAGRSAFNPATDNYAPRAHFPTLLPGALVNQGANLPVTVIPKDPDGTIAYVDLFLDNVLVSRVSASPYTWVVSNLTAGQRTLRATVVDHEGASTDVPLTISVLPNINRSDWILAGFNSSGSATGTASNAKDGDSGSRWTTFQTQAPGQRFTIDLGKREIFQRIILRCEGDPNDYPRIYTVRGSHNGVNYVNLITGAGTPSVTDIQLLEPATYRYIDILQSGSSGNNWWSIHELDIYGPTPGTSLTYASWRLFHFGADLDDPAKQSTHWGDNADFDGDGLSNVVEYAFNSSPLSAASRGGVVVTGHGMVSELPYLDLSYRRWRDPSVFVYRPSYSDSLAGWSTTGFSYEIIGSPADHGDGTETVNYRLVPGTARERGFFRLELQRP